MNTQDTISLMDNAKIVIICVHGFINSERHDFLEFKDYFDKINTKKNLEVKLAYLYDPTDKKTYKHKLMYRKLLDFCQSYADKGYIIYLLGYSFSAGICAHVSSQIPQVRKLILASPTIYLVKTKLLRTYLKVAYKSIKLRIKHGKKAARIMAKMKTKGVVRLSYNIALATFRERKWFRKVKCKTLMFKGSDDSYVTSSTFYTITKRIKKAPSTMKVYPGKDHLMIIHITSGKIAYDDILAFAFHFKTSEQREEEEDIESLKLAIAQELKD